MQPDQRLQQMAALAAAGAQARAALTVHVAAELFCGLMLAEYQSGYGHENAAEMDEAAQYALRCAEAFARVVARPKP